MLSQGPVDPATFVSSAPNPSAVSSALATLRGSVRSYQRTWIDTARLNAVQDMLFHFPGPRSAQIFLQSAQKSLQSGKITTSGAVPGLPGARRVTYFGATSEAGVGQAITLRVGDSVVLLSSFSAAQGNDDPITQADAIRIAAAQDRALRTGASGGAAVLGNGQSSSSDTRWLVLGVVALAVLGLLLVVRVRHRRTRGDSPGTLAT